MIAVPIFIVGAGGFGREVASILSAMGVASRVKGFVDDDPSDEDRRRVADLGLDVVATVSELSRMRQPFEAVVAVGSPQSRRRIVGALEGTRVVYPVLVHPHTSIGSQVRLEEGVVLAPGVRLSTNICVGRHVHVDQNAVVGHDTKVGAFARINPNACVSGSVTVGEGSLVGASATVLQGLTLAPYATVGAGAVVTRDVSTNAVVKGVPAK